MNTSTIVDHVEKIFGKEDMVSWDKFLKHFRKYYNDTELNLPNIRAKLCAETIDEADRELYRYLDKNYEGWTLVEIDSLLGKEYFALNLPILEGRRGLINRGDYYITNDPNKSGNFVLYYALDNKNKLGKKRIGADFRMDNIKYKNFEDIIEKNKEILKQPAINIELAKKILRDIKIEDNKVIWQRTVEVMRIEVKNLKKIAHIFELKHPNIFQYLGIELPNYIICKYAPKLSTIIGEKNNQDILGDIVKGMWYLHLKTTIISRSIMIDSIYHMNKYQMKIECSKNAVKHGDYRFDKIPEWKYRAPEEYNGEEISYSYDIWQFGLLLYELYSNSRVFEDFTEKMLEEMYKHKVDILKVLKVIDDKKIWDIIKNCLQYDPKKRPDVNSLLQLFKK